MLRTSLASLAVLSSILVAAPVNAADSNCDLNNPTPACTSDLNKPVPPAPLRPRARHFHR